MAFITYRKRTVAAMIVLTFLASSLVAWVFWPEKKAVDTAVEKPASTADSSSKGEQTSSKISGGDLAETPVADSKNTASKELKKPSGNFVSNHRPAITNPQSSALSSSCETTPGATCAISFTKNDKTITLDSQKAGPDGAAYWQWDLKEYGFSAGTWKITAKATLNGKSLVSGDALEFMVAQ